MSLQFSAKHLRCARLCPFEELLEKEDDGTGNEPKASGSPLGGGPDVSPAARVSRQVNGVGLMEDRTATLGCAFDNTW